MSELSNGAIPGREYLGDPNVIAAIIVASDGDARELWCKRCAARAGEETNGVEEIEPIYSFSSHEADAPEYCSWCEELLRVGLTDDGLEYVRGMIRAGLLGATRLTGGELWEELHEVYGEAIRDYVERTEGLWEIDYETEAAEYRRTQEWTHTLDFMTEDCEHGGEPYACEPLDDWLGILGLEIPGSILATWDDEASEFLADVEAYLYYFDVGAIARESGQVPTFGHDFSLTRNGHGTGFWDRGHGELGEWLSDLARSAGTSGVLACVQLDPAGMTPDPRGGYDWDLRKVLPETFTAWAHG